jgi:transcriptional regulator with XRE-family HTH domain
MVPILGDRVKAAIEAYHTSVSQLAAEVGDSQQTLSLICRGVTKKTRASRVANLAEALDVPETWLTGLMKDLPGSSFMGGLRTDGTPAAWQLSVSRWVQRSTEANVRDLRQRGRRKLTFEAFLSQGFALTLFINPGFWREFLLEDYSAEHDAFEDANDPLSDDTQVQFTRAILDILDPWLRGTHKLNYRNIMRLLGDHVAAAIENLNRENPRWRQDLADGRDIVSRGVRPSKMPNGRR